MHYTTKEGQTKSSPYKWIALLRELFIEEISLLNQYQAHLANSLISEVNQVWQHILQDERTHYGELLCLLRQYDKEQAAACQQFAKKLPHIPSAGQPYRPVYAQQILVNHIRADIQEEGKGLLHYEQRVLQFPYKREREKLHIIMKNKKSHIEALTQLLLRVDVGNYGPALSD